MASCLLVGAVRPASFKHVPHSYQSGTIRAPYLPSLVPLVIVTRANTAAGVEGPARTLSLFLVTNSERTREN